jgi:hypothetical protein
VGDRALLGNGITDALESSTILIYSVEHMSLYTQNFRQDAEMIKWLIKSNEAGVADFLN